MKATILEILVDESEQTWLKLVLSLQWKLPNEKEGHRQPVNHSPRLL
jgi:hypothetical protein